MTRLVLLLLGVLLSALASGVDAKSKGDQIRMYQFTSDYCDGMPDGANIDIKREECVNINARSIKPTSDKKREKWLSDINNGATSCALIVWDGPGCTKDNEAFIEFPENVGKCYTSATHMPIRSVMFTCDSTRKEVITSGTITTTLRATSWSVGDDQFATPSVSTEVLTLTSSSPTTIKHGRRELERRDKHNVANVWMFHPWALSVICYECYTKKPKDFSWIKCNSIRMVDHNCGPKPVDDEGNPFTSTTTETTATTTTTTSTTDLPETFSTSTVTEVLAVTGIVPLVARSWHKKVTFRLPWNDADACADAEWEKRGKANTEIRLQEVHIDGGNDCAGAFDINLPPTVLETETVTTTTTTTYAEPNHTGVATVTTTTMIPKDPPSSPSISLISRTELTIVPTSFTAPTEIVETATQRSERHANAGNVPPHSDL